MFEKLKASLSIMSQMADKQQELKAQLAREIRISENRRDAVQRLDRRLSELHGEKTQVESQLAVMVARNDRLMQTVQDLETGDFDKAIGTASAMDAETRSWRDLYFAQVKRSESLRLRFEAQTLELRTTRNNLELFRSWNSARTNEQAEAMSRAAQNMTEATQVSRDLYRMVDRTAEKG